MSYYHAKRTAIAKQYLAERDAADRVVYPDGRLMFWKDWLDDYHTKPHATRVDWRPRYPLNLTKEVNDNGEKIIEGEFTELEDAATSGGVKASSGLPSDSGEASQGGEPPPPAGAAQGQSEGKADWLEEAYPQDGEDGGGADQGSVRPRGPGSQSN